MGSPERTSAASSFRIKTPSPAAQGAVPAISLGTNGLHPWLDGQQYIWYGVERGADGKGTEEPMLWRVLSNRTNDGQEGLFLLSERLFGVGKRGGMRFAAQSNDYQSSELRQWCRSFETDQLSAWDRLGLQSTTKTDGAYTSPDNGGIAFGEQVDILSGDRVFLPSTEEVLTALGTNEDRLGRYWNEKQEYWLRSPVANSGGYSAGYVDMEGRVVSQGVDQQSAVRPALNLDGSRILYAAAVNQSANPNHMGLEPVQTVQSSDFRLILQDPSRNFTVTTPALTAQAGGLVTLNYEGASYDWSNREYISVILVDGSNVPVYYGKVLLAQEANGSVTFALPTGLADGTYTLKVFNERYEGERTSGVGSPFTDVPLTIQGDAEVTPVPEVRITVPAPVTGQKPKQAVVNGGGCTMRATTWNPEHTEFQPQTHYEVSVEVQAAVNHPFTPDTLFYINDQLVIPTGSGDVYTVTYTAFPDTQAKPSTGGGSNGGGGGSSSVPSVQPETEVKPDGSRVETITRPDGTKVETTTNPSGDKTVIEIQKDGTVTTTVQKVNGTMGKTTTTASGQTKSEVKLSQQAIEQAERTGQPVELPIPPVTTEPMGQTAPVIQVETQTGGSAKATIPVTNPTPNTVVVQVHQDGTEEIIRKSVPTETGVTFTAADGVVLKVMENPKTFSDTKNHWAEESIAFVTSRALYSGTSADTFSPDLGMTRGMLAMVLHNLERNPGSVAHTAFQDVEAGMWYDEAVSWAAERGIVSGYGDGRFGPNDPISREQLAVMLYQYAGRPTHTQEVLSFRDADAISLYAQDAMCWAVEQGILHGTGDQTLDPSGIATRAQVAATLYGLMEAIG